MLVFLNDLSVSVFGLLVIGLTIASPVLSVHAVPNRSCLNANKVLAQKMECVTNSRKASAAEIRSGKRLFFLRPVRIKFVCGHGEMGSTYVRGAVGDYFKARGIDAQLSFNGGDLEPGEFIPNQLSNVGMDVGGIDHHTAKPDLDFYDYVVLVVKGVDYTRISKSGKAKAMLIDISHVKGPLSDNAKPVGDRIIKDQMSKGNLYLKPQESN
jgi:hypothetical protein